MRVLAQMPPIRWRLQDGSLIVDLGNGIMMTILVPDWVEDIDSVLINVEIEASGEPNAQPSKPSVQ